MNSFFIFYYLATLLTGVFCLGCYYTIQRGNKNEVIKYFLACYALFNLFIFTLLVKAFFNASLGYQVKVFHKTMFVLQFFGMIFFIYMLTYIVNKIYLVPFAQKANRVLFIFSLAIWGFCVYGELSENPLITSTFLQIIDDEILYAVMFIYNFAVFWIYRGNIEKKLYKTLKGTFLIAILFVPGFVFDEIFAPKGNNMIFTPLFFIIISIFSLRSFFQYSNSVQSQKYTISAEFRKEYGITDREVEVIGLLLKGYTYNRIAQELVISLSTVRAHVTNIYKKSGVNSRHELYNLVY